MQKWWAVWKEARVGLDEAATAKEEGRSQTPDPKWRQGATARVFVGMVLSFPFPTPWVLITWGGVFSTQILTRLHIWALSNVSKQMYKIK